MYKISTRGQYALLIMTELVEQPEGKPRVLLHGMDVAQLLHPQQVIGSIEQPSLGASREGDAGWSDRDAVGIAGARFPIQFQTHRELSAVVVSQFLECHAFGALD